jgi:hypothetical protein
MPKSYPSKNIQKGNQSKSKKTGPPAPKGTPSGGVGKAKGSK